MQRKPLNRQQMFYLWCALACALVAADQFFKMLLINYFSREGMGITITPFFNLVRAHNKGAAFSLLADAGGWQHWFFILLAVGISIFILILLWQNSMQRWLSFGLSFILSGATGNLIDRLNHGYVVDFIDFHWAGQHFPAFNLADCAITIGVALLVINELIQIKKKK